MNLYTVHHTIVKKIHSDNQTVYRIQEEKVSGGVYQCDVFEHVG